MVFIASSFKRATPTSPFDIIVVGIQRRASYLILLEKVVLLRRSFEQGIKWAAINISGHGCPLHGYFYALWFVRRESLEPHVWIEISRGKVHGPRSYLIASYCRSLSPRRLSQLFSRVQ
jgi:hypothetical protein